MCTERDKNKQSVWSSPVLIKSCFGEEVSRKLLWAGLSFVVYGYAGSPLLLPLAAVGGLLIEVVPLVAKHRLEAQASVAVVHGLSCPEAGGIFLDQGSSCGPWVGRWLLNPLPTKEFRTLVSFSFFFLSFEDYFGFLKFELEDDCFTMSCWFLPYNNVSQP